MATSELLLTDNNTTIVEPTDNIIADKTHHNESDSEGEAVSEEPEKELGLSHRRRKQNDIFKSYVASRAEKFWEEKSTRSQNSVKDDDVLTVRKLMAQHESKQIITSPREYQLELYERAKNENTIAVLDTGAGKTLIAVLLLRHILDEELENRTKGHPPRIAFFLVHSVALVFQQFAVLDANLDHPIDRFCGSMNVDTFDYKLWSDHFKKNMTVVCTADILLDCLLKSFIRVKGINLLIFDEAHKTKKNHAYARIVKDFVVPEPKELRPKIFGMTASPVDSKLDVEDAARNLESLLNSRIATTSDMKLLRQSVNRPDERLQTYARMPKPYMTDLCHELHSQFKDVQIFQKAFRSSEAMAPELGEWAADRLLELTLNEEAGDNLQRRTEQTHTKSRCGDVETLNKELRMIGQAQQLVRERQPPPPNEERRSVSSKVWRLMELLEETFPSANNSRCLVFVNTRHKARILADLVSRIGNSHMRVAFLIGCRGGETADNNVSVKQQLLTISRFRKGEINIVFATSIAEEGLDIPDCNTVIRFDLYLTVIQYIQSRGRARHKNSKFYTLIEQNNGEQRLVVDEAHQDEGVIRRFCQALPEDRLLKGNEDDPLDRELRLPVYTVRDTGAKLTFGSALSVIERFVSCLQQIDENSPHAAYYMSRDAQNFICELVLPPNSPVISVSGKPWPRKALAKRSAAFEACLILLAEGHMDNRLIPVYRRELPKMRNAHLAISSKKAKEYRCRIKPKLWDQTQSKDPTSLYITLLYVEDPAAFGRPSCPLAMLTRVPLIDFPSFPIFPRPGVRTNVVTRKLENPMSVSTDCLDVLSEFTFRFYKDFFNKGYEKDGNSLSYWIAPALLSAYESANPLPSESYLDWKVLDYVHQNERIKWTPEMPNDQLKDTLLIDPYDGTRHMFTEEVECHRSRHDPVPEGYAKLKGKRGFVGRDILDYSLRTYGKKKDEMRAKADVPQPVLRVKLASLRYDWLHDWSEKEAAVVLTCFVCPAPMEISAIPPRVATTAYMFPSVITRLESYLIAQELCEHIGLSVEPRLALEAITKDSDNTSDHDQEQTNFQRGMGHNYERLEFIGDTFLKMATSIALYAKNATDDEFHCHVKRMLLICNKNLFNTAMELELFEYVRTKGFNRATWYQHGLKLVTGRGSGLKGVPGKGSPKEGTPNEVAPKDGTPKDGTPKEGTQNESTPKEGSLKTHAIDSVKPKDTTNSKNTPEKDQQTKPLTQREQDWITAEKHRLEDKSIADVCEALIGASLLSYPSNDMDMAVKAVTKLISNTEYGNAGYGENDHQADKFSDYWDSYSIPDWEKAAPSAAHINLVEKCANEDPGYRFKSPRLLKAAFTHPSTPFSWENIPSYQRLEFLGDSLLDMAAVSYLFHNFPEKNPHWLTEHKMAMVSNKFLGTVCAKLGFHKHLKHISPILVGQITDYVTDVTEQEEQSNGARDYWVNSRDPPKCLPDLVEAYIGALFVDSQFNYAQVQRFFNKHLLWYFEDMAIYDTFASSHPTTALSNLLSTSLGCHNFRLLCQDISNPSAIAGETPHLMAVVMVHDEIVADSTGTNSRYAKVRASKKALEQLEGMLRSEFKSRFRCDCVGDTSDVEAVQQGLADCAI